MATAAVAVDVEAAAAVHKWTAAAATSLVTTDSLLGLAGFPTGSNYWEDLLGGFGVFQQGSKKA